MMRQDSPSNAPGGAQIVNNESRLAVWLAVLGLVLGSLGFMASMFAWQIAASSVTAVSSSAEAAGRAAAKAETATARANTAEIYAKQIYTELNRLGYPVKTPAEDHVPQPPEPVK